MIYCTKTKLSTLLAALTLSLLPAVTYAQRLAVQEVPLTANHVLYDRFNGKVYASIPGTAALNPNRLSLGAYESETAPISGSDDIFVSTGFDGGPNMLEEYTSAGQHVRSIAVPSNTGAYAANGTEYLRGIAVNDAGQVLGFNGTFTPELTVFSPLTYTFVSRTDANWSISNNGSSGSVGVYQGYSFVLTEALNSPSAPGIIRFNPDGTSQHFGGFPNNSKNYLNLTVGLNGKLYVLYSDSRNAFLADVYDPASLQLLQTIAFQVPSDHNGAATELRNLAVDVSGSIYTIDLYRYVYHLDAQGNLLQSVMHTQNGYTTDIKINPLSGGIFISIGGYGGQILQTDASLSSFRTLIQLDPNQYGSDFIAFGNAKLAAALNSLSHVLWNSADGQVQVRTVNPDGTQTALGTFGPYTDSTDQGVPGNTALWKAVAIARTPDGTLRVLWQHPDGRVMLWRFDASGTPLSITGYGPYSDADDAGVPGNTGLWQAVGLSVSTEGETHLLWDHPDGRAMLWNVNADDTFTVIGGYGPYSDSGDVGVPGNTAVWHTTALANAPDGSFRLLWNHPDGRVMLWNVSGPGDLVSLGGFGPYTDSGDAGVAGNTALWKAIAVQVGTDGQAHLLWDHPDGRAMVWGVDSSYSVVSLTGYGPYTNAPISSSLWQAIGLALTPANLPYVLWNNPDNRTVLWNLSADGTVNYSGVFEATSDSASQAWVPTALSGN